MAAVSSRPAFLVAALLAALTVMAVILLWLRPSYGTVVPGGPSAGQSCPATTTATSSAKTPHGTMTVCVQYSANRTGRHCACGPS